MSEFLLIIPEGWTQLDWQYITNNLPNMGYQQVMDYVATGYMANIDETLKAAGMVPEGQNVVAAKLIDDSYFLVQFA